MADDLTTELIKGTEEIIEEFKINLEKLLLTTRNLDRSSNAYKSLRIEVKEDSRSVALWGVDYMFYVIHGRGPGRFPPPDPITGEWPLPFPVAKEIAEHGNIEKYRPVANEFNDLFKETIRKITKKSGEIALAFALKFGTIN